MKSYEKLMENKIIILGSGTCNIEVDRANTSILICINETKIVYDFGYRTLIRLKELDIDPNEISHIIISHFHPDHFSDLIPFIHSGIFSKFPRKKVLNIYSSFINKKFIRLIDELLLKPEEFKKLINFVAIKDNSIIEISNISFTFKVFSHFSNVGIKFRVNNKIITISGDINFFKDDLSFFKNSYYCFLNIGELDLNKIYEFYNNYRIKNLILLHSYNPISEIKNSNIVIGKDLMEFKIY